MMSLAKCQYFIRTQKIFQLLKCFYLVTVQGKGLIDSVIKTSKSGYFMRKLVEVSREYIIDETDCRTKLGLEINLSSDDCDNVCG